MTIKEFSQKHSLVFFWATIFLVVLFLLTACVGGRGRYTMMRGGWNDDYGYERYNKKMINRSGNQVQQRQMMSPNDTNQPLINNTPGAGAAGTFEAGMNANPNVPLEVQ